MPARGPIVSRAYTFCALIFSAARKPRLHLAPNRAPGEKPHHPHATSLDRQNLPKGKGKNMVTPVSSFIHRRGHLRCKQTLAIALCLLAFATLAGAQTWTSLTHQPGVPVGTTLLLTDGTVMAHQMTTSGFGTGQWLRLTPDSFGSYLNGTWSTMPSLPSGYAPLFFASAVLPDGRVVIAGGEYNNTTQAETNKAAIFNPATNSWTSINPPSGVTQIGDASSVVLPNGTLMIGPCCFQSTAYLLNASNLTWTLTGSGKADSNTEEGWTLLPNGKVLTVDTANGTNSELYNPSTGTWSSAGSTIVTLPMSSSLEVGPGVLRPDGTVFWAGGTSNTAVYNSSTGAWSAGPTFSGSLDVADGPAAVLPSGNVLVQASPGLFNNGSQFFEFNGTSLLSVPAASGATGFSSFQGRMLVLPTGQILFTSESSTVQIYTPSGTFQTAWRPTITSVATSLTPGSANNAISGTQFNGLSQGAMYGDDAQAATNYPLVRITNNATGHVFYAKTHNHSTMGVATGGTIVSTQFDVPANTEGGASTLQVVVNGIPSNGVSVNVTSVAKGILGFAGQFSCLDGQTCDTGTISVTVNTTTETISYDGACSGAPPFGFSWAGNPCIPQTIVDTLVSAFNSDPNSPVTASSNMDTYAGSGAFDVVFTAKQPGPGGNYPTSLSVVSNYGSFQVFGDNGNLIRWSWTPFPQSGGVDPNTLTEITPLSGSLTGGH